MKRFIATALAFVLAMSIALCAFAESNKNTVPTQPKAGYVEKINGYTLDSSKYVPIDAKDTKIKSNLPQIMEQMDDNDVVSVQFWLNYATPDGMLTGSSKEDIERKREFFTSNNKACLEKIKYEEIQYIPEFAPVLFLKCTKQQIEDNVKLDFITDAYEGQDFEVAVPVEEKLQKYYQSTLSVNGTEMSFTSNEYYKVYADYYAKYFYDLSKDAKEVISDELYKELKSYSGVCSFTVVFKDQVENAEATAKALKLSSDSVTAFSKKYSTAMVTVNPSEVDSIVNNENVKAVYEAFPYATRPSKVTPVEMNETYKPTALDARKVLRYSANLISAPEDMAEGKEFFFKNDVDFDGKLTAKDARFVLRMSAKLEKNNTFSKADNGSGIFWKESYFSAG